MRGCIEREKKKRDRKLILTLPFRGGWKIVFVRVIEYLGSGYLL